MKHAVIMRTNFGRVYYFARQYDPAVEQVKRALEVDPNYYPAKEQLRLIFETRGYKEAIDTAAFGGGGPEQNRQRRDQILRAFAAEGANGYWKTLLRFWREDEAAGFYPGPSGMAVSYAHLGEMNKAFELLKRAIQERDEDSEEMKVNPMFDIMRSDARFAEMLKLSNLSP